MAAFGGKVAMNEEDKDYLAVFALVLYGGHTLFPFGFLFIENHFILNQFTIRLIEIVYIMIGIILTLNVFYRFYRSEVQALEATK